MATKSESRPSLRSIARRLNLSVATVSRALNNDASVNSETVTRVQKMANELGYNSSVGRRVTTSIGLVYANDVSFSEFDSWVLAGMMAGVREQKFDVTMINIERDKSESETYTQFFMRKALRGIVLRTTLQARHICRVIADEGFPMVVVADHFEEKNINFICYRSEYGSRLAVDHLLDLGHRRIALVTHQVSDSDHSERIQGYRKAIMSAGIEVDPRLTVSVCANMDGGVKAMNQLMSLPKPPTAVYFADPLTTVGALNRAYAMGVRVPGDLSVVGFDDGDTRNRVYIPYAAVCQDASRLGFEASQWLTRSLSGMASGGLRQTHETNFEINQTTGLPPAEPIRILPDGTRLTIDGQHSRRAGDQG
jgi:DNA-binding LacI/PurR family transcriptional regulator